MVKSLEGWNRIISGVRGFRLFALRGELRKSISRVCMLIHYGLLMVYIIYFYPPPQRSWGKVIFSEACVKNSVHRGVVSQHALQAAPWAGTPPPGRFTPPGKYTPLGQVHPLGGRYIPRQVTPWAGTPPTPMVNERRYASYWNAFFLTFIFFVWCESLLFLLPWFSFMCQACYRSCWLRLFTFVLLIGDS